VPYLLEIEIQSLQNVNIYIISMDKTTVKIIKNSKKKGGLFRDGWWCKYYNLFFPA
jgi:hypothetical protein